VKAGKKGREAQCLFILWRGGEETAGTGPVFRRKGEKSRPGGGGSYRYSGSTNCGIRGVILIYVIQKRKRGVKLVNFPSIVPG